MSSASAQPAFRLYRALRWLLRAATRIFFRRIEVVGAVNIPTEANTAVIFAGNHPNSLLDPVLITAHNRRVVHFAAADVLFQNRVLRFFLTALGAVPVRRRMDHGGPVDNRGAFSALEDILGEGRAMGIFPEGISHDSSQLAPLKSGTARIALRSALAHPEIDLYIVPTGLVYFTRNRFRSSVLIQFGPAIRVEVDDADDDASGEPRPELVSSLTSQIDQRLRALTVNADTWERVWVLDGVRRLYQPPKLSLSERSELARKFNDTYPTVKNDPEIRALYDRVRSYLHRISADGLTDVAIRDGVRLRDVALRLGEHLVLVFVSLPLFVLGAPIFLPLGLLLKIAGRSFAPRPDVVATTKFVLGFLFVLAIWATGALLVAWSLDVWWGMLVALLFPLAGWSVIHVISRVDALRHLALTSFRVARLGAEIEALRAERAELVSAVNATVERLRPIWQAPSDAQPGSIPPG